MFPFLDTSYTFDDDFINEKEKQFKIVSLPTTWSKLIMLGNSQKCNMLVWQVITNFTFNEIFDRMWDRKIPLSLDDKHIYFPFHVSIVKSKAYFVFLLNKILAILLLTRFLIECEVEKSLYIWMIKILIFHSMFQLSNVKLILSAYLIKYENIKQY